MSYLKVFLLSCLFAQFCVQNTIAQNVGISNTPISPDASAGLEIRFPNKGFLIPRISLSSVTDATTIANPAEGLLIFNTNDAISGGLGKGFYFNSGSAASPSWQKLLSKDKSWVNGGNEGTDPDLDFLGTTDNKNLTFITNNQKKLVLSTHGRLAFHNSAESVVIGGNSAENMDFSIDRKNTFIGNYTAYENILGERNVAIGFGSLQGASAGISFFNNTAIGFLAGQNIESGNRNILIGDSTWVPNGNSQGFVNIGNLIFGDRWKYRNLLISESSIPNIADSSSILELKSTKKGLLIPRMSMAEKNAIVKPAEGLIIYQNDGILDRPKGLYLRDTSASMWYSIPQTIFISKTVDETVVSSTTVQEDDELKIFLGKNQTWEVTGLLNFFSANATPDVRFIFTGPAGSTIKIAFISNRAGTNNNGSGINTGAANSTQDLSANVDGIIQLSGTVSTSNTDGNLSLFWAQNVSNANLIRLKAGSYLKLVRMR